MLNRFVFSLLLIGIYSFTSTVSATKKQPNVIIVLTDDQGYGDFGCKGNPYVKTPHIDRFAAASFEMNRFYVNPVCSPTRASLMTGRNAYRTGVTDTFKGNSIMRTEEVTLPEILKDAGYQTGLFGKWHLGDNYPYRAQDQGFDHALYHLGGGLGQPSEPLENGRRYTDAILFENGKKVQTKGYCCDVYFDEAIKWYRKQQQAGKPFFAYIASNTPHGPFHDVPQDWLDYYAKIDFSQVKFPEETGHAIAGKITKAKDQDTLARIYAMVSNLDDNMGKLMKALDKDQLLEDTIVIFFNDNGPATMRYVSGFRGKKSMVTEGGVRTPIWWHYAGKFKAGASSDLISAHYDIMPTLAELCGAKMPLDRKIDGKSILPTLKGVKQQWDDRLFFMQWHRGSRPEKLNHIAVFQQNWKLQNGTKNRDLELYHMGNDPYAQKNVIGENPEKSKAMFAAYEAWLDELNGEYPNMWEPLPIIVNPEKEPELYLTRQEWQQKGSNGEWVLSFPQAGTFEVSFKVKDPKPSLKAELLIAGQVKQSAELSLKDGRYYFNTLVIEKGLNPLMINLTGGKKVIGPWHAFLKKE